MASHPGSSQRSWRQQRPWARFEADAVLPTAACHCFLQWESRCWRPMIRCHRTCRYRVQMACTDTTSVAALCGVVKVQWPSFWLKRLAQGSTQRFRVLGLNTAGPGAPSKAVSVRVR